MKREAPESDSSNKLQRLNDLRRSVPYCSKSALQAILEDVAQKGLPEAKSAKQMRQATQEALAQCSQYGDLLLRYDINMIDGSKQPIKIVNLMSFIYAAHKSGGLFYTALEEAFQKHGFTRDFRKFNLVLYSDECFPGNPLSAKADKKLWVCYATWKEFGYENLSNQHLWIPLFVHRSNFVSQVSGHMGQIIRIILESIFNGAQQALPDSVGVLLHGPDDRPIGFHFDFAILCQDGASQKYSFGIKGDSGSKYCLKCTETAIVPEDADPEEAAANSFKPKASLQLTDDACVLASFDRCASNSKTMTAADFAAWQQASGWTYSEDGLLASKMLRCRLAPVTNFMHDWMHGIAQGTMPVTIFLFLEALAAAGSKSWHAMMDYLQLWTFPKAFQLCSSIFSKKRIDSHRKAGRLKVSASEILTLFPVLQYFCLTIGAQADCQAACKAFLSQCHFLELLLALPHLECLEAAKLLDQACEKCHRLFDEAGWTKYKIKKFHWMYHYGDSLASHKLLLSCFCQERKHKDVLAAAKDIHNLSHYEDSVYNELLAKQLHALQAPMRPPVALSQDCRPPKTCKQFLESLGIVTVGQPLAMCSSFHSSKCGTIHKDDLVLIKTDGPQMWDCGQVCLNFSIGGIVHCLVDLFTLVSYDKTLKAATWTKDGQKVLILGTHVLASVVWSMAEAGRVALIPGHLQG